MNQGAWLAAASKLGRGDVELPSTHSHSFQATLVNSYWHQQHFLTFPQTHLCSQLTDRCNAYSDPISPATPDQRTLESATYAYTYREARPDHLNLQSTRVLGRHTTLPVPVTYLSSYKTTAEYYPVLPERVYAFKSVP